MKLLFDHNLSPQLRNRIVDVFPGSEHIYNLNMDQADDHEVWTYAQ